MASSYLKPTTYDKCVKDFPDSSNVVRAEFHLAPSEADYELFVTFKKAGTYRYSGVPLSVWMDFIKCESAGRFMHANIINRYPVMKVNA